MARIQWPWMRAIRVIRAIRGCLFGFIDRAIPDSGVELIDLV